MVTCEIGCGVISQRLSMPLSRVLPRRNGHHYVVAEPRKLQSVGPFFVCEINEYHGEVNLIDIVDHNGKEFCLYGAELAEIIDGSTGLDVHSSA